MLIRISDVAKRGWLKLREERGEGAINTIAIIVGLTFIAGAIIAAMNAISPEVGQRIMDVIRSAIGGGG